MKQRHHLPRHWCLSPSLCWCSGRGCCCLLVRTPGFLEVPLVAGGTPWTHVRSRSYIEKLELWCIVFLDWDVSGLLGQLRTSATCWIDLCHVSVYRAELPLKGVPRDCQWLVAGWSLWHAFAMNIRVFRSKEMQPIPWSKQISMTSEMSFPTWSPCLYVILTIAPPTRVGDLCCPGDLQCFQLWRRFSTRARDSAGRDFWRYIKIHLEAVYELFRYVFFKNII